MEYPKKTKFNSWILYKEKQDSDKGSSGNDSNNDQGPDQGPHDQGPIDAEIKE